MRTKYISGLDEDELDELAVLIEKLLPEPWNKPTGLLATFADLIGTLQPERTVRWQIDNSSKGTVWPVSSM